MTILNQFIENHQILQSSIARKVGKPQSSIARVVNSKEEITSQNNIAVIRAIAKILDVTAGQVLDDLIAIADGTKTAKSETEIENTIYDYVVARLNNLKNEGQMVLSPNEAFKFIRSVVPYNRLEVDDTINDYGIDYLKTKVKEYSDVDDAGTTSLYEAIVIIVLEKRIGFKPFDSINVDAVLNKIK